MTTKGIGTKKIDDSNNNKDENSTFLSSLYAGAAVDTAGRDQLQSASSTSQDDRKQPASSSATNPSRQQKHDEESQSSSSPHSSCGFPAAADDEVVTATAAATRQQCRDALAAFLTTCVQAQQPAGAGWYYQIPTTTTTTMIVDDDESNSSNNPEAKTTSKQSNNQSSLPLDKSLLDTAFPSLASVLGIPDDILGRFFATAGLLRVPPPPAAAQLEPHLATTAAAVKSPAPVVSLDKVAWNDFLEAYQLQNDCQVDSAETVSDLFWLLRIGEVASSSLLLVLLPGAGGGSSISSIVWDSQLLATLAPPKHALETLCRAYYDTPVLSSLLEPLVLLHQEQQQQTAAAQRTVTTRTVNRSTSITHSDLRHSSEISTVRPDPLRTSALANNATAGAANVPLVTPREDDNNNENNSINATANKHAHYNTLLAFGIPIQEKRVISGILQDLQKLTANNYPTLLLENAIAYHRTNHSRGLLVDMPMSPSNVSADKFATTLLEAAKFSCNHNPLDSSKKGSLRPPLISIDDRVVVEGLFRALVAEKREEFQAVAVESGLVATYIPKHSNGDGNEKLLTG